MYTYQYYPGKVIIPKRLIFHNLKKKWQQASFLPQLRYLINMSLKGKDNISTNFDHKLNF